MVLVAGAATASLSLIGAPGAWASGRPAAQPVTASDTGTLGSLWRLKSMHDDLNGAQIEGGRGSADRGRRGCGIHGWWRFAPQPSVVRTLSRARSRRPRA
jgi:hypothetical protein